MTVLPHPKRAFSFLVMAVVALGLGLVLAGPAYAHVGVTSDGAVAGQPATITVSVPNEEDDAGTVSVDLRFPDGQPLTNVAAAETPGWTAAVDAAGIVWSGGPLTGDDRAEFTFTGTLPAGVTELVFRVLQNYDNGDTVRWIEAAPPGGGEPQYPAPVLAVAPGAPVDPAVPPPTTTTTMPPDHGAPSEDEEASPVVAPVQDAEDDDGGDDGNGVVIAVIIGAVVAVAAVGGTLIYRRSRTAT